MEPNFEQLLSSKIKRLGKSTVVLDEPTLWSSYSVGVSTSEVILTSSSHTQHMDAVKVGDKNYYLSDFGKVFTGEVFRGLIIMSNKSPHHALTDVELTIWSTCQNKGQTKTLLKKNIAKIEKASANSQIIEFRAEFTDTYVIEIKARYKSEYFKDIVRKMDIDNMSPSQRNKLQNMESYRIDYVNKDVTRNFSKKFKFQTRPPFQLEHSIVIRQNKYLMEIIIENDTSLLFLQSIAFNVSNSELDLLDLNPHEEEMIGSIMRK